MSALRELSFPRSWIGKWLQPRHISPPANPLEVIERAIAQPIASPGLETLARPGQKVALIVDDQTRHTPAFLVLPYLIDKLLQAGIAGQDICVVIALGTHRLMTPAELEAKLGPNTYLRFPVVQSASADLSGKLYLGQAASGLPAWVQREVVQADLRLGVGMITPHMDAGFSGGAKIILPGVCGAQTVDAFHVRAADSVENPLGNPQAPLRLVSGAVCPGADPVEFHCKPGLDPRRADLPMRRREPNCRPSSAALNTPARCTAFRRSAAIRWWSLIARHTSTTFGRAAKACGAATC